MRSSFFGCRGWLMEYKNCPHNNSLEVHFCNPFSAVCTLTFVFLIKNGTCVTQSRYVLRKMEGLYWNKKSNFALHELTKASRLINKKKVLHETKYSSRTLRWIYIEPLIVGHMWQSYCTITKLLILWHKWY